jgi:glutaminyl-peptide cyclotransferase
MLLMSRTARLYAFALVAVCSIVSCKEQAGGDKDSNAADTARALQMTTATFNADTAYDYVAKQVAFGPRVPGTKQHRDCAAWLESVLKANCDTVYRQEGTVTAGAGAEEKQLPCINLIGSINPTAQRRVLLLAHWDTRPWADQDVKDKDKPILAPDDAGSGVAVLLELARTLNLKPLPAGLGIDILLTDVEDYGKSEWGDDSYCLGTQYWAQHPHVAGYKAAYGILLDMVGARGSSFPMEQTSTQYAPDVQQRVWSAASRAGFSSYFPYAASQGGVTDDHKFVNEMAHIPTIDIIALTDATPTGFPPHWHTHKDNMQIIDKGTLQAVGQTLVQTLSEEGAEL